MTDMTPAPSTRPTALILASTGTILSGAIFVAVGVASVVQGHGLLSAGVGAMLVLYGLGVCVIGWAAWKGHFWSLGALVASSLLHLAVAVSTAAGSSSVGVAAVGLVALVVLIASLTPATRRALRR